MRQLTVKLLSGDRIDQAYPLVQAALPQVGLEQWRAFARAQIAGNPETSGIQSVLTEQDYVAGLSVYRVDNDLCHGPTLTADHFMALDLFSRTAVIHALADFLEDLARRHGCGAVHTHVAERADRWDGPTDCMASVLCERGHVVKSLRLCKLVEQGPQPAQSAGV